MDSGAARELLISRVHDTDRCVIITFENEEVNALVRISVCEHNNIQKVVDTFGWMKLLGSTDQTMGQLERRLISSIACPGIDDPR